MELLSLGRGPAIRALPRLSPSRRVPPPAVLQRGGGREGKNGGAGPATHSPTTQVRVRGGGSPPRASLLCGTPHLCKSGPGRPAAPFSRSGHTWSRALGLGWAGLGRAAATGKTASGRGGRGWLGWPGRGGRSRGGAECALGAGGGAERCNGGRRRRGCDGAEPWTRVRPAASPGKCRERGRGATAGEGVGGQGLELAPRLARRPPARRSLLLPEVGKGRAGYGEFRPGASEKPLGWSQESRLRPVEVVFSFPRHPGPSALFCGVRV